MLPIQLRGYHLVGATKYEMQLPEVDCIKVIINIPFARNPIVFTI